MRQFRDNVAVITGAASGIGRALARSCAAKGMRTVLADVERESLAVLAAELRASGASIFAVPADVSKAADVERVAEKTVGRFGAAHLLFNSAGVAIYGPRVWEATSADWDWIVGVNLSGVFHGLRTFVPLMLDQGSDGHIVNIASAAGMLFPPGMGPYSACKAAVIALSETLHRELEGTDVGVSVACPGFVKTRLLDSARNRPNALQNASELELRRAAEHAALKRELQAAMENAMFPEEVATRIFDAVREERLYVFTHNRIKHFLTERTDRIVTDRNPPAGPGPGDEGLA